MASLGWFDIQHGHVLVFEVQLEGHAGFLFDFDGISLHMFQCGVERVWPDVHSWEWSSGSFHGDFDFLSDQARVHMFLLVEEFTICLGLRICQ